MPWGLERWHGGRALHFITFSCCRRQPLLSSARCRDLFLTVLEQVRRRYRWVVLGYVVMPEHVHLLVSEPQQRPLATAMQALKLGFARRVLAEQRRRRRGAQADLFEHCAQRIWQARYYDFNVCTAHKRVEKLRYMHRNPGSPTSAGFALAGVEAGEAWSGGSAGTVALEPLPRLRLPGGRTGSGERLERARAKAQKGDNFSPVMILPRVSKSARPGAPANTGFVAREKPCAGNVGHPPTHESERRTSLMLISTSGLRPGTMIS